MRVLNVFHTDTVFEIELRRSELEKLVKALDLAKIDYSGDNLEEKEATKYMTDIFYPVLTRLLEETKDGNG